MKPESVAPLGGMRVIDFTSMVAGPWATRLLADCGAEVIKIEAVGDGDTLRLSPPMVDGISRVFTHLNCGKKCISLDLKNAAGLEAARALIRTADVVVENFRPGVMARLGLDFATVALENPRLVYCSVSGYGQSGPNAGKAAYAPVAHAASGFDYVMGTNAAGEGAPLSSRVMVADFTAGIYAFGAIQTALLHRDRNGMGSHVDVTLMEGMMSLLAFQLQEAQSATPVPNVGFRPVKAADAYISIPIISVKAFHAVFKVIGHPEWAADPAYRSMRGIVDRYKEIMAAIGAWAATRSARECAAALDAGGVACSTYAKPSDLFTDPHLKQRGVFAEMTDSAGTFQVLNPPFRLSSADCGAATRISQAGEDTADVLGAVLGADAFKALAADGAFG